MPKHLPKAAAAQIAGFIAAYSWGHNDALPALSLVQLALIQGLVAASASLVLLCPRWWAVIHLLFCPLLVLASSAPLPAWSYGLVFSALLVTYWSTFRTQVPLYLSNRHTAHRLAAHLGNPASLHFLDIGSGTGALLRRIGRLRPGWQVSGIESAPGPYAISRWKNRREHNVSTIRGDFWQSSLGEFDVVYAFLSPVPMPQLWRKALREMRPGSLLVSNSFEVPGVKAHQTLQVDDARRTRLFLYRIPPRGR